MTVNQGMRGRASYSTNREDTTFAKGIALLDPNENPFTLASMEMGRGSSKTIDYHYFEDELLPESAQINYSTGFNSSATDLTVDDASMFAVGDIWIHNETREPVLVLAINESTNVVSVDRDYGQAEGWSALAGSISDDDYLTWCGNAFMQGHPLPAIRSTVDVEYVNYCQDIRTPFGMSEIAIAAAHRGEPDWPFQERKTGITHQRKQEYINFWGKPYAGSKNYYSSSVGNTGPATAGGINHFIEAYAPADQKIDHEDITQNEFQDSLEYVFEFGPARKFCYCDPKLRTALDRWGISKLNTFSTEEMFGIKVARWLSSHGEVIFITHKMLRNKQAGDWRYAFFLDMERVKQITYSNIGSTRVRRLKPYEATGETAQKAEFQTIQCIHFGQAGCHARMRFKTFSA